MIWEPIDKKVALLYKGYAILLIAAHNFMHVFPRPRQNEFSFNRSNFDSFLHLVINEPENILQVAFSYLGHFGVQVFIFLSAYGLTKKYFNKGLNYKDFIWSRSVKIYPAFFLALLTWYGSKFAWYWLNGSLESVDFMYYAVLLKLTLLSNFISGYALKPVGPWWFFPFIIQFYLVYPAILKVFEYLGVNSLTFISLFSLGSVVLLQNSDFNFYYTILPYLPVFCFGIYVARKDSNGFNISKLYFLVILVVFILGNLYEEFRYFTHFCALVILISAFQYIRKISNNFNTINKVFLFIGTISMQIFFVHGFLRTPLVEWAVDENNWLTTDFYCFVYLLFCMLVAFILFNLEHKLRYIYRRKPIN